MRPLRTLLAALLATALLASPALAEVKETPMEAPDAAKIVAMFQELTDTATKHAADCAALARGVDGVVEKHRATLEMSWAAKKAKKILPPDAQILLDKRAKELTSALERCWSDAAVKTAFARMKPPEDAKK